MALCVVVDSGGTLQASPDSPASCAHYVLLDGAEYNAMVATVFTPADVAYAFGWGFSAVVLGGYFAGYAVGIAKQLINKL